MRNKPFAQASQNPFSFSSQIIHGDTTILLHKVDHAILHSTHNMMAISYLNLHGFVAACVRELLHSSALGGFCVVGS